MSFLGFGGGHLPGLGRFHGFGPMSKFKQPYRCYSMAFSSKTSEEIVHGGKIIMPPSALEQLSRLHISYPMLFKLSNTHNSSSTHCGVLEFVAEEGKIYVPHWMMNQLCIQEGDLVEIENVSLKLATFSKFQPQTTDFLDITNPKAVLESKLRSFACLTRGDTIGIEYNEKIYELMVLETKPNNAVTIIECDMKVDFAPPVGYQSPEPQRMETDADEVDSEDAEREVRIKETLEKQAKFKAFTGEGQRLNGKVRNKLGGAEQSEEAETKRARGVPNYDYKKGKITFEKAKHLNPHPQESMDEDDSGDFVAFQGQGQFLRQKKNKSKKTH